MKSVCSTPSWTTTTA